MQLFKYILIIIFAVLQNNYIYSQDSNYIFHYIELSNIDPDNIDVKLFRSVNNYRTDFLDKSLNIIDKSVLPAALVIPSLMFIYGRAKDRPYEENTGVLLALSETINLGLTFGIKNIIRRERPYKTLSNVYSNNVSIKDKYSFPSNHTSTSFTIATIFVLRYPKYPQIYAPMYLWGTIAGYGRIYWGMHYPSDVLGGAVLGSLTAIAVYSLRSEIIKGKNRLFNEDNIPDENRYGIQTIGWASAIYFLTAAALEYFFTPSESIRLSISPSLINKKHSFGYNLLINF